MPRSPIILEKQPWEERLLDFDFAGQFSDPAAVITSATILTPVNLNGGAVTVTVGTPAWTGTRAQALYQGGTDGDRYLVTCRATADNGERAELEGILAIRERGA